MSFIYFIKLIIKNLLWLVFIPIILAGTIFYFTRHEQKVYSSESTIYTGIASGYSLSGNSKSDFYTTSNAFDNLLSLINSRETKQETLINLLAAHLVIKKHDPALISWEAYEELQKLVPQSIRNIVVKPTADSTAKALNDYMDGKEDNVIFSVINSDNVYYSLNAMDNIKASRINNSDLVKISYQSNDAIICKQTMEFLEATFMKKYRKLKEGQSESVVGYFEAETRNAYARLNAVEQRFMEFNQKNDIINYYEQTKAVAIEKENLYVQNHNLEMDKMANLKSLDKVNESIKGRLYQVESGNAIIRDRENLSGVNRKIAVGEIMDTKEPGHQSYMDSLRKLSVDMEDKLNGSVNDLYSQSNIPNGIPTKSVLDEWLKTTLHVEESKARLNAMDKRKVEFAEEYRKYAPLGAMLKKIERQINVSEQEYLELLHGLNLAKLTQQNNELTTKLNVVDEPYLPLKPNKSKRMVLVIVGFIVGLIMVLAVILARALINKTLQQPEKAGRIIGIPLLGIYPLVNSRRAFIEESNLRLVQQLLSKIETATGPISIGLLSIQEREGKTTLLNLLHQELTKMNYTVEKREWNNDHPAETGYYNIMLTEFPSLDELIIKPGMIPKLDHTFLVCRANRIWARLDKELLNIFVKTTRNQPLLLLNGVNNVFAEEYVGEVPRRRSFLRSGIKRLIKFEFGNRKKIR